jgi:hypothetical protein
MHRFKSIVGIVSLAGGLWFAPAEEKVVQPFDGKSLNGWQFKNPKERSKWRVGKASLDSADSRKLTVADGAELVNAEGGGVDIYTAAKFGDVRIEVELMVPKGSNSGIYVMGEYEVQVLDSFGKKDSELSAGDIGALYGAAPPKQNASKAPGEWQKFIIDFRAPRFDDAGKKTANAKFVKVELNGKVLHENVEMKGPTPSGVTGKEAPTGPLMFQGDHGPVAYRNIKISAAADR